MKSLIPILLAFTLMGCSAWKPTLRDVSKLVDVACAAASIADDRMYQGKPASYWCGIVGVALDAADAIVEAADK